MKVACRVCDQKATYNGKLGIYYCRDHGFNTEIKYAEDYMSQLADNVENLLMAC